MVRQLAISKQYLYSGVLVFLGLYLASLYNYLLFHSLAEIFSIVVAFGIFMVTWNSRRFLDNNYLLVLGVGYLFVGGLDLIHTLTYKGMGIFQGYGTNPATQLWIAARYTESLSLFIAPLFFRRRLRIDLLFTGYTLVFLLLLISIFYWNIFPICFIEGVGLTPFKKISEYIISLILLSSITLLLKNRSEFDRDVLLWIVWSILLTIVSELAFTFYIDAYGFSNLIGHFLKIASFYLIYKALIQTGLTRPYDLLFRNLKQSEALLFQEKNKIRNYLDIAGVVLVVIGGDQKVSLINKKGCEILGYDEKEILGKKWFGTFIPEKNRDEVREGLEKLMNGEIEPIEYSESPVLTKAGEQRMIAWHNAVLRDERGNIIHTLSSGEDITERKKMEEELRRSHDELEKRVRERTAEMARANEKLRKEIAERERADKAVKAERQRFHDVLEILPVYLVLLTPDYHVPFANRFFRERFGESHGRRCFEYLFGRSEPCEICETYTVLKTTAPHEWEWTGPDGRNYDVFDFPFTDTDGSTLILEMGIDITERKQAEEAARVESALRESIENSIVTGIVVVDKKGRIVHVNPAFCHMTGWREEELVGTGLPFSFWPPEDLEARTESLRAVLRGRIPSAAFETHLRRKSGEPFDALVIVSSLKDDQGRASGWVSSIGDITARKEIERRIYLTNVLLELFSKKTSRKEYMNAVVDLLQGWSRCRCVGIRVLDEQGFIPYESYVGFSQEFWKSENRLSIRKDQCACIRVITGSPDPQDIPMVTSYGSFYCGNTFKFVGDLSEEEKRRFRGVCIENGFASVSIAPIRYRGETIGAIHLADEREGHVSLKAMEFIESIAPLIGEALHRFNLEEEIRESENRLRLLSSQLLTIQEKERKRVAHELHDGLGQMLTAIKFKVENTLQEKGKGKIKEKSLEAIIPMIRESVEEVRRIQMDLRPSILDDLGILATLAWFCREFQSIYSAIRIEKKTNIEEHEVPAPLKTVIYRVTQEALNNIAKHSGADLVHVSLRKTDDKIELAIRDNGTGFDLERVLSLESSERGFGLSGMKERAELSGGSFAIESIEGEGTIIKATWPI